MAIERTLSIIKPDATGKNLIGEIIAQIEKGGLSVRAARMIRLDNARAEAFYAEHRGKVFYDGLINFMSSGPIVALVLEGENAIERYRELMGSTNSPDAAPGTIRNRFGENNRRNAVHGSDGPRSAEREISFFFSPEEVFSE